LLTLASLILALPAQLQAQDGDQPPQALPQFAFQSLGGSTINPAYLSSDQASVIMLFDPTCDHCQKTVEGLAANADQLGEIQFLFVAFGTSQQADIKDFQAQYLEGSGLDHYLAWDQDYMFESYFGSSPIPSLYLYDSNNNFVKAYKGEEPTARDILAQLP
jgi:thiol-disulfide isomerase/thioredoxin